MSGKASNSNSLAWEMSANLYRSVCRLHYVKNQVDACE